MDYKVALYIRLSREDEDKDTSSESIKNQISLLSQYTKENNLIVYDTYIDDGYSGTTFDRPAFNRMIKDIEDKKINMVITKDMSRLGRDYIETGNLVEKYFPSNNIRYIAVTDNIDTYLDNTSNDITPFKAIMNDMYAKDISKKIRASLKAKMKEGKYIGGRAPYGYKKDKNDKNHLVINKEQSIIVTRIFEMALEGLTPYRIADVLTKERIKPPSSYYDFKWQNKNRVVTNSWNAKTIKDILINQTYIGNLVQNKKNKVNYKVNKIINNNPKDYIIIKNTHTPIIDEETFNKVQQILPKRKGRPDKKEHHLLEGLLYCKECGGRISITPRRKKDNHCYTICNKYRTYIKEKVCTVHSNNYDKLEEEILNTLKECYLPLIDKEKIVIKILESKKSTNKITEELKYITKEIAKLNDNLDTIYLDKINNKIADEQYQRVKNKLKQEIEIKQNRLGELNKKNMKDNIKNADIDKYISKEYISRNLIISLIERIEISENKILDVKFTFSNSLCYNNFRK